MANRTATACAAPEHAHAERALCAPCMIADGRPHAHPHDHLGAHDIECACDCHAHEVQQTFLGGEDWDLAALFDQLVIGACGARGPPVASIDPITPLLLLF